MHLATDQKPGQCDDANSLHDGEISTLPFAKDSECLYFRQQNAQVRGNHRFHEDFSICSTIDDSSQYGPIYSTTLPSTGLHAGSLATQQRQDWYVWAQPCEPT